MQSNRNKPFKPPVLLNNRLKTKLSNRGPTSGRSSPDSPRAGKGRTVGWAPRAGKGSTVGWARRKVQNSGMGVVGGKYCGKMSGGGVRTQVGRFLSGETYNYATLCLVLYEKTNFYLNRSKPVVRPVGPTNHEPRTLAVPSGPNNYVQNACLGPVTP